MDVYGNSFVYEIWEFACISSLKSPLNTNHYQNDEDGCVAVDFLHGLLVCGSLKIKKIDILGILSSNITKSCKFYQSV